MDAKKKRNKKKKGNQGKNTGDVTSSAGEADLQHHNHESAPAEHHNGVDADDATSSVGANANTTSSFGEAVVCYQNNEPAITQENHKANSAVPVDQRSIAMSESSVELDTHKLNDAAKLDKLHETIKHLEDEKSLWLQKVNILESELEKFHEVVSYHSQNEVLLEEKLNSLQNGYDLVVKKEASFQERLNGLEEMNKALQLQVKVLEETSNNTAEENQRLVKILKELDSRVQTLEAKTSFGEVSAPEKVPQYKMMDQKDLVGSSLHQQIRGFTEGSDLVLESSGAIISDNNCSQINNSPSNLYAVNHIEETSLQHTEKASINSTAEGLIDLNEQQFHKARMSAETVSILLDDIQIHQDDVQQSGADDETAEVPFSDAPIIGAPFRLISFVARYVSGADLVGEK